MRALVLHTSLKSPDGSSCLTAPNASDELFIRYDGAWAEHDVHGKAISAGGKNPLVAGDRVWAWWQFRQASKPRPGDPTGVGTCRRDRPVRAIPSYYLADLQRLSDDGLFMMADAAGDADGCRDDDRASY